MSKFPSSGFRAQSYVVWAFLEAQWYRICLQIREMHIESLGGKPPQKRKWKPTPIFLTGKFHGPRSLRGYSP